MRGARDFTASGTQAPTARPAPTRPVSRSSRSRCRGDSQDGQLRLLICDHQTRPQTQTDAAAVSATASDSSATGGIHTIVDWVVYTALMHDIGSSTVLTSWHIRTRVRGLLVVFLTVTSAHPSLRHIHPRAVQHYICESPTLGLADGESAQGACPLYTPPPGIIDQWSTTCDALRARAPRPNATRALRQLGATHDACYINTINVQERPRLQRGKDSEVPTNGTPFIGAAARAISMATPVMRYRRVRLLSPAFCRASLLRSAGSNTDSRFGPADSLNFSSVSTRHPKFQPRAHGSRTSEFGSTCTPGRDAHRYFPAQRTGHTPSRMTQVIGAQYGKDAFVGGLARVATSARARAGSSAACPPSDYTAVPGDVRCAICEPALTLSCEFRQFHDLSAAGRMRLQHNATLSPRPISLPVPSRSRFAVLLCNGPQRPRARTSSPFYGVRLQQQHAAHPLSPIYPLPSRTRAIPSSNALVHRQPVPRPLSRGARATSTGRAAVTDTPASASAFFASAVTPRSDLALVLLPETIFEPAKLDDAPQLIGIESTRRSKTLMIASPAYGIRIAHTVPMCRRCDPLPKWISIPEVEARQTWSMEEG
ncbi:hypothetical protein B0H17DRAFT_1200351 [Mycena rosella]|uniref:Uncharacterized protein n=1 Tax=Mycena rosella TaxID=1033263 RepID=A0AAD7DJ83_MYCRO|nr:hypothetical protein B0H17DRAFT_1200351 [Mycena rosella]